MSREIDGFYSLSEVARIFGLTRSRLRYWAQTGFVNPKGYDGQKRAYTFEDLVEIKAARELLEKGIPLQRVRRNLKALRQGLPNESHPLRSLRVRSDGDSLVVLDGQTALDPVSGQALLDFDVSSLSRHVAEVLALNSEERGGAGDDRTVVSPAVSGDDRVGQEAGDLAKTSGHSDIDPGAYGWFVRGLRLDDNPATEAQALDAYRRAIDSDAGFAAAHTNLGNILHRRGDRSSALRSYELACGLDPDQPEARFNLANIYEEEGDVDLAIAEYRRVLKIKPDFSDAHYNLAMALESVGSRQQAKAHWQRFLELSTGQGADIAAWRERASGHLLGLES